ncbi:MAG: hypothetical protein JWQ30_56 [Sediminibacterium sp.]|nr:hypothetical protein [Sediminibacterium sp.]
MGNLGFQELLLFFLPLLLLIALGKLLTDWFHEIKKRNRYMEAQIRLLMQIAAKQGVDIDKIAEIGAEAQLPLKKTNS